MRHYYDVYMFNAAGRYYHFYHVYDDNPGRIKQIDMIEMTVYIMGAAGRESPTRVTETSEYLENFLSVFVRVCE